MEKTDQSGIIKDIIDKQDSVVVLIRKPVYPKNWQHPHEVTNFVIDNFEKTGEIDIFDTYEKR